MGIWHKENSLDELLLYLAYHEILISIVYGLRGSSEENKPCFSVDILTANGNCFEMPFQANSFEHAVGIAYRECVSRGWIIECSKSIPEWWIAGGGPGVPIVYGYGYWTGPDDDLLCVQPGIKTSKEAERLLSPLSKWKFIALIKYYLKRMWTGSGNEDP